MRTRILQTDSSQRIRWLIRILCIVGLGVAGYLTWTYLADVEPYCGATHDCADVQHSPYANVAGFPVPVIGLTGYLILLVLSLLHGRVNEDVEFYLPVLSFGAALIGVLYSAYLTYLEAFVILAWCYWCVTSTVIITAIWGLSVFDLYGVWSRE